MTLKYPITKDDELGFVEVRTRNYAKISKYIFYISFVLGVVHIFLGTINGLMIFGITITYLFYYFYNAMNFPKYILHNDGSVFAEVSSIDIDSLDKEKKIIIPDMIIELHNGHTIIRWTEDWGPAEQGGPNLYYKIINKETHPEYFL